MKIHWSKDDILNKGMIKTVVTILSVQLLLFIIVLYFHSMYDITNANEFLETPVNSRAILLQKYLNELSINASYATKEIIMNIEKNSADSIEEYQNVSMPKMLNILENSNTSGAFLIFGDLVDISNRRDALYLRDTEPDIVQYNYKDLLFLRGPSDIAKNYKIPVDSEWKCDMDVDLMYSDYYFNPLNAWKDGKGISSESCGYWSPVFRLTNTDKNIMTYTIPLVGENGKCYGIFGLELSFERIITYLPTSEIPFSNPIYMVGVASNSNRITKGGSIISGSFADFIQKEEDYITLKRGSKKNENIHRISTNNGTELVGVVKKLSIYNANDFYQKDNWMLIGMVEKGSFNLTGQKFILLLALIFGFISIVSIWITSYVYNKKKKELMKVSQSDKEKDSSQELFEEFIQGTEKLTFTEKLIFQYYLDGKNANEVAELMSISINTVMVHNNHIYSKLNVTSKDELSLYVNLIRKSGRIADIK